MSAEFEVAVGEASTFSNGWVTTEVVNAPEATVKNSTSGHEAVHVYLLLKRGVGVKRATRIAGVKDGLTYNGLTEPEVFDPVATVGPHSIGLDGAYYDVDLAEEYGADVSASESTARYMISDGIKEIGRITRLLDEQGTVTGSQMKNAMNRGEDVLVRFENAEGEVQEYMEEDVRSENLAVRDIWSNQENSLDFDDEHEVAGHVEVEEIEIFPGISTEAEFPQAA